MLAVAWLLQAAGYKDAIAVGKHLLCAGMHYTFGLNGGLALPAKWTGDLRQPPAHTSHGKICGAAVRFDGDAAALRAATGVSTVDWMGASASSMQAVIDKAAAQKVALGAWMLDQSKIAGVGLAWASEIAHVAGLDVSARMCDQKSKLRGLGAVYASMRDRVLEEYREFVDTVKASGTVADAIAAWYGNLRAVRTMLVYGVTGGSRVQVGGRSFWVASAASTSASASTSTSTPEQALALASEAVVAPL